MGRKWEGSGHLLHIWILFYMEKIHYIMHTFTCAKQCITCTDTLISVLFNPSGVVNVGMLYYKNHFEG